MFILIISVVCLIISLLALLLLYNIINKFIYVTTWYKLSDNPTVRYIFTGLLLTLLIFLEYDMVVSIIHYIH